jgi:hypothetical protein
MGDGQMVEQAEIPLALGASSQRLCQQLGGAGQVEGAPPALDASVRLTAAAIGVR